MAGGRAGMAGQASQGRFLRTIKNRFGRQKRAILGTHSPGPCLHHALLGTGLHYIMIS